jgi:hypothetical protein
MSKNIFFRPFFGQISLFLGFLPCSSLTSPKPMPDRKPMAKLYGLKIKYYSFQNRPPALHMALIWPQCEATPKRAKRGTNSKHAGDWEGKNLPQMRHWNRRRKAFLGLLILQNLWQLSRGNNGQTKM